MTMNYIKPEVEIISIYSEGVLASSDAGGSGEDLKFDVTDGIEWL